MAEFKRTSQPGLWHTLSQAETEQALQTGIAGLTEAEVRRRLAQYRPNRLALVLGGKVGFQQHVGNEAWPRLDSIPFESQHRFVATFHRDSDGEPWLFVKGAPERILGMCRAESGDDGEQPLDVDSRSLSSSCCRPTAARRWW